MHALRYGATLTAIVILSLSAAGAADASAPAAGQIQPTAVPSEARAMLARTRHMDRMAATMAAMHETAAVGEHHMMMRRAVRHPSMHHGPDTAHAHPRSMPTPSP